MQCIKPGNVNYLSGHHDTAIDDFVKSYEVTSNMITLPNLSLDKEYIIALKVLKKRQILIQT